jgi:hypothetical protein
MSKREENIQVIINWLADACSSDIDTCTIEENCGTLWIETDEGCIAVSAIMTEGEEDENEV